MQAGKPTISIIVPVYDVELYIQQCIDSIRRQTYPELEIILVDDGSPDNCGVICDENSARDSRITVLHKENGGLSSARNCGIEAAAGKYIAFVDGDDAIHPQYIEILAGMCAQYGCDIAQCGFLAVAEDSVKLPVNPCQFLDLYSGREALGKMCQRGEAVKYSVAWNKLYRRELFEDIRYPEGRIHEDEFITYRLLWKAEKIAVTNQYLYYYLQRPTSIMGREFGIERLDVLAAFKERLDFFREQGLEKEYSATLRKYVYLLKKDYALLKEHVKGCENICARLQEEKEKIEKRFPAVMEERIEDVPSQVQMEKDCSYPKDAKIVLYGAGKWGRIYYQWISQNHQGTIVGWVDNAWYAMSGTECGVMPLDLLVRISYDYVFIAVQSRTVQEEVRKNLVGWGIRQEKILFMEAGE